VFLIACVLLLLWFRFSFAEMRSALQWWYSRQAWQTWQEAESIRNGLLQQSFSLRRSLELALAKLDATAKGEWQAELALIEQLHKSLQQTSDRLSPPYIRDNLPLAVQHLLERQRIRDSRLQLEMQLPTIWRLESYETSRAVLTTLEELLTMTLAQTQLELPLVSVQMNLLPALGELVVQFAYSSNTNLLAPAQVREFTYLKRAFEILTNGNCFHHGKESTITWHFRW
jgi:hypothetical protein